MFESCGPFAAHKAFTFNGVRFKNGDAFPHELVDKRKLRKMYEAHFIVFMPAAASPSPEVSVDAGNKDVPWADMNEKAIKNFAFECTGKRFRQVHTAVAALEEVY